MPGPVGITSSGTMSEGDPPITPTPTPDPTNPTVPGTGVGGVAERTFQDSHAKGDTDFDDGSLHHTLGTGRYQALPGNYAAAIEKAMPPVGQMIMMPRTSDLSDLGWLLCNGAAFDQTEYPELFEYLGTATLPDMRVRIPLGAGSGAPINTNEGVAEASRATNHGHAHTHQNPGVTIPSGGDHNHQGLTGKRNITSVNTDALNGGGHTLLNNSDSNHDHFIATTGSQHTHDIPAYNTGQPVVTIPRHPYQTVNFYIRARSGLVLEETP